MFGTMFVLFVCLLAEIWNFRIRCRLTFCIFGPSGVHALPLGIAGIINGVFSLPRHASYFQPSAWIVLLFFCCITRPKLQLGDKWPTLYKSGSCPVQRVDQLWEGKNVLEKSCPPYFCLILWAFYSCPMPLTNLSRNSVGFKIMKYSPKVSRPIPKATQLWVSRHCNFEKLL